MKLLNEIGNKKLTKYILPHDDKYIIKDFHYNPNLKYKCENCNKSINYVVEIKNNKNKVYKVGMDCAETLSSLDSIKLNKITLYFKNLVKVIKQFQKYKSDKTISILEAKDKLVFVRVIEDKYYKNLMPIKYLDKVSLDMLDHTTYFDEVPYIKKEKFLYQIYKDLYDKTINYFTKYDIKSERDYYNKINSFSDIVDFFPLKQLYSIYSVNRKKYEESIRKRKEQLKKEYEERLEKERIEKEKIEKEKEKLKNSKLEKNKIIYSKELQDFKNKGYALLYKDVWLYYSKQGLILSNNNAKDVHGNPINASIDSFKATFINNPLAELLNLDSIYKSQKLELHYKNKLNIPIEIENKYIGDIYLIKKTKELLFTPKKVLK